MLFLHFFFTKFTCKISENIHITFMSFWLWVLTRCLAMSPWLAYHSLCRPYGLQLAVALLPLPLKPTDCRYVPCSRLPSWFWYKTFFFFDKSPCESLVLQILKFFNQIDRTLITVLFNWICDFPLILNSLQLFYFHCSPITGFSWGTVLRRPFSLTCCVRHKNETHVGCATIPWVVVETLDQFRSR